MLCLNPNPNTNPNPNLPPHPGEGGGGGGILGPGLPGGGVQCSGLARRRALVFLCVFWAGLACRLRVVLFASCACVVLRCLVLSAACVPWSTPLVVFWSCCCAVYFFFWVSLSCGFHVSRLFFFSLFSVRFVLFSLFFLSTHQRARHAGCPSVPVLARAVPCVSASCVVRSPCGCLCAVL